MIKVKAIIERGNDGSYGIYIDLNEDRLTYGILGDGNSVKEAIKDFCNSYEEMRSYYKDTNKKFQEAQFTFQYDVASFLQYYTEFFSLAGLSRLTGINQKQLSHYITGRRNPSKRTVSKINSSIHDFAQNLNQVQFS